MERNNFADALLTDLYQITMAYAYWLNGRHNDHAVFDLFFRKNPFGGGFTLFAGLSEALEFVKNFRITDEQIAYLRANLPDIDEEFFEWLRTLDCSQVRIDAIAEGSFVFPRMPLIRVEGPLAIANWIETPLLNFVNFPSLVATNAFRFRLAAGDDKLLMEFGLRRAQGPDGAMSASRYSYMGGFDATSNVRAGQAYGIPIRGTHAHSFVSSYTGLDELKTSALRDTQGKKRDFVKKVLDIQKRLGCCGTNESELAAFIAYAQAFPNNFLALLDTYSTLKSGVPNMIFVAAALCELGYSPVGGRLDSGDLAKLSKEARKMLQEAARALKIPQIATLAITASNDINEDVLEKLNQQGHEIDAFGIGTHLATCQAQPALGCVYKLVEINGTPRIKLSDELDINTGKITLPGRKIGYRLSDRDGYAIMDILQLAGERPPAAGRKTLCMHPFNSIEQAYVTPHGVMQLHVEGRILYPRTLEMARGNVSQQRDTIRAEHMRRNPTEYKVCVSPALHNLTQTLWKRERSIPEL